MRRLAFLLKDLVGYTVLGDALAHPYLEAVVDQQAIWQTVQAWPVEEQLEFVHRLWDHIIDSGWHPELTDELKAELDRRLAAYEADPTNVFTWEQVVAHVKRPR